MTGTGPRMASQTISERIADYVIGMRFNELPAEVVERTKELLVYHLGTALRGTRMPAGQQAIELALDISDGGDSSIIGDRRTAGLLEAVLAHSALIGSTALLDLLSPSGTMPGLTVHPAAWVVGERAKSSGAEFLTAVAAGYDVMAKLHNGELPYETAARPTKAIVEPFGVAATAARLLNLSHEQTVRAFGHAGQFGMSVYEGLSGGDTSHMMAARNGVLAAMLAKAGLPSARTIVEGSHGVYRTFFHQAVPDSVHANLATLGHDFEVRKARITRYPVSATNVHPIELTQELVAEHGLVPDRIASVDLVLPRLRQTREAIYGTYLRGPATVVAIALTGGQFDPEHLEEMFTAEAQAVRERVRLRFEDDRDFFYAQVEITTTDGARHVAERDGIDAGHSLFDWAEWLAAGGTMLAEGQLAQAEMLMRNLEDVPDVGEVLRVVRPA